jgi:hypothetical protein
MPLRIVVSPSGVRDRRSMPEAGTSEALYTAFL